MAEKSARVAEIEALIELMEVKNLLTLKVGDIELARVPNDANEETRPKRLTQEEAEVAARNRRRESTLAATGRIVSRSGT